MGQAKRKLLGNNSKKRIRFIHLLKKISKRYSDYEIAKLANNRNL